MKTLRHFNDLEVLFRDFFNTTSQFETLTNSRYAYPVDIFESDKGLQIEIAAIGLKRGDIDIRIEDGDVLRITHKKDSSTHTEEINYIHRGIARRAFSFGWKVSAKFDLDKLVAKLEEGLLSITIPFSQKAEPKRIEII